jgi:hypothetical protein
MLMYDLILSTFKNEKNLKWISFALISIIVIVSSWSRFYNLDSYVSNEDDHLVVTSILNAKEPLNMVSIKTAINDTSLITYNSVAKRYLRFAEKIGYLESIMRVVDPVRPLFCVPNESSYAPFQFFFTQMLISKKQSLKQLLFWGRLPSLVFSLLSIFIFICLINKVNHSFSGQISSILVIAIFSLSIESVIYAKQMESYAIGLFAAVMLLFVVIEILKKVPNYNLKRWLHLALLFSLMIYMQYQMLIYVFAAIVTILCYYYVNSRRNQKIIFYRNFLLSFLCFAFIISPVYILFISKHSSHASIQWYQGPSSEYLYHFNSAQGLLFQVKYTTQFFLFNCADVFINNCSFYSGDNYALNVVMRTILVLFSCFFVYGLVVILKSSEKTYKYLGLFLFVFLITWVSFVLLGKLTMSPTRHTLILLPIFCLVCHFGLTSFMESLSSRGLFISMVFLTTYFIIFSFTKSIRLFLNERRELYTQQGFVDMIKSRDCNYIITRNEIVTLIPELRENINLLYVSKFKSKERWVSKTPLGKRAKFCFINFTPNTKNLNSINHFFSVDLNKLKIDSMNFGKNNLFLPYVKSDELHRKFPRIVENSIYFAEYSD